MFIPTLAPRTTASFPGRWVARTPDETDKITWANVKKRPRLRVAGVQVKECG